MREKIGYFYLRADGRWEGRFMIGKKSTGSARLLSVYGEKREEMEEKMAAAEEAYAKNLKRLIVLLMIYPTEDMQQLRFLPLDNGANIF